MYAKYATWENTSFADTKKLPVIKKKVMKLEDQNNSLWKDVTFNLKISLNKRAEPQVRKEKEIQWETRLFHKDGEYWVYDEPLLKYLGAAKH
uniref:Uncharacterized protein n=1 Tax=Pan paniscus TaxID=9597 RepID=A0A2R9BZQ1_PANPA